MVLQTSHTGVTDTLAQGDQAAQQEPVEVEPRYTDVYESERIMENWELMKIAQVTVTIEKSTTGSSHTKFAQDMLNAERVSNMLKDNEYRCKGRVEGVYETLLQWKQWKGGLAFLGDISKVLKKHGYQDLAESFPP